MITKENLLTETKKVADRIDSADLPETAAYFEDLLNFEGLMDDSAFSIATALLSRDKPKHFPAFLLEYIVELYEMEIAAGNHHAMNDLGAMYYNGDRGFEQNFGKAVLYYGMAADHGNRQAQENLGYCYYYGRDMEPDYEKAFHYFALGAFDGHLISLYKIGDMYLNGYYVQKNEREAFLIYNHCLDTMSDEAAKLVSGPVHLRLGDMFLKGIGTEQDPEQALMHYSFAEIMLYQMVKDGDVMYKKSLRRAIEGQSRARAVMQECETEQSLPPL
jgi:TPR repeat protein